MRIANNTVDWILKAVAFLCCAATALIVAVRWNKLPDKIPTHFELNGEPNGFGGKKMLIVLLVVMVAITGLMYLSEMFPKMWNLPVKITDSNREFVYRTVKYFMEVETIIMITFLAGPIIAIVFSKTYPGWIIFIQLGVFTVAFIATMVFIAVKGRG
ncbi:MAG: DUF1648 domain-containing protein [Lachnospiraceae bacterium]|jgi:uncharacterized membrane protein|nr:DUF1648 domain-containing protein [Lachnospiraceae bacterium]